METETLNIFKQQLTEDDFGRLSSTVYNISGIHLPETKKQLLEGRIRKRMKVLEFITFRDYLNFLFSEEGEKNEIINLIDVVTTNKTDFFREKNHFDFMMHNIIPVIVQSYSSRFKRLKVWSAGCSTGEEPYTISMLLADFSAVNPNFYYDIYASDISTEVLKKAAAGIFDFEKLIEIPENYHKKYLLKSKDPSKKVFRFAPDIREKINYSRINLIEKDEALPSDFDIIFCRNVIIYFDKKTQEKVIMNLISKLQTGGYLFLGHSETIMGMHLPLERIASTIYKKI